MIIYKKNFNGVLILLQSLNYFWVQKSLRSEVEGSGFKSRFGFPLLNFSIIRLKMFPPARESYVWLTDSLPGLSSKTSQPIRVKIKKRANETSGIWSPQSKNVSGMCLTCSASAEILYVFRRVHEVISPTDSKYLDAEEDRLFTLLLCSCGAVIWCLSISDAVLKWLWSMVSIVNNNLDYWNCCVCVFVHL